MLLIGRTMSPLLWPSRSRFHDLVAKAAGGQYLKVCRKNFVEWIIGNQPNGRNLDHGSPGFGPLGFGEANHQHIAILDVTLPSRGGRGKGTRLGHVFNHARWLDFSTGDSGVRLMRLECSARLVQWTKMPLRDADVDDDAVA